MSETDNIKKEFNALMKKYSKTEKFKKYGLGNILKKLFKLLNGKDKWDLLRLIKKIKYLDKYYSINILSAAISAEKILFKIDKIIFPSICNVLIEINDKKSNNWKKIQEKIVTLVFERMYHNSSIIESSLPLLMEQIKELNEEIKEVYRDKLCFFLFQLLEWKKFDIFEMVIPMIIENLTSIDFKLQSYILDLFSTETDYTSLSDSVIQTIIRFLEVPNQHYQERTQKLLNKINSYITVPPQTELKALKCPNCKAPLENTPPCKCEHCGVMIELNYLG